MAHIKSALEGYYKYSLEIVPLESETDALIIDSDSESIADEDVGKHDIDYYFPDTSLRDDLATNLLNFFNYSIKQCEESDATDEIDNTDENRNVPEYDKQKIEALRYCLYQEHPELQVGGDPNKGPTTKLCHSDIMKHLDNKYSLNFFKKAKYLEAKELWAITFKECWYCSPSAHSDGPIVNIYMDKHKAENAYRKILQYCTAHLYEQKVNNSLPDIYRTKIHHYVLKDGQFVKTNW